ncbi:tRNA pseudouridine(38-40) synthase TruA [Anaerotignum lactatifermentans]|uniref:tRNA pseudouridine synthase A n=1 Tax=Anaerotignum lactatifermentans TaxID=160404 RepID=A0ABS2GAL5_9FIRM|nr:tRNA pseudouridine(38-40) synthase TruA [Anaerotignum lactatifermentans]MBM6829407.1 tRNA pseudouridine(38-40) synthase TruA [Anaerotignum lactatifermentans]MBM6877765.1 tRNA pseudouridine(38-40) synthase TruA [Anaerotignum lactatifermentans]MBM6950984.1 tRNA pseudouridine(38-40) synthase TruA [Anaerotignum lactatifermentans]
MRILLTIAYDGTRYSGWQKQKSPEVLTVEGELEKGLRALFRDKELECIGASRTDRGVHALGQRAVVDVETTIPVEKIPLAIRPFLPEDIVVTAAREVPTAFHPRYDCVKKTYEYRIYHGKYKNPKERLYSTFVYHDLDVEKMNEGAKAFVGTHDFAAFCAAGSSVSTTVRTIFDCHMEQEGQQIRILVTGDGFLYNMVRIIAGTLIAVGQGKLPAEGVAGIIESRDRTQAGQTAEPQGLTLLEIYYDLP